MSDNTPSAGQDNPMAQTEAFDRSLLRATREASPHGIRVVDGQGRVVSHNSQFLKILQIPDAHLTLREVEHGGISGNPLLLQAAERIKNPDEFIRKAQEF
ncbi:MAG: PAS domain-containing protein [Chromatocurvus sp.]